MKYLFSILLLLICSTGYSFSSIAPQVQKAAQAVMSFDESRAVAQKAEAQGPIRVEFRPLGKDMFYACWIGDKRTIVLNADKNWNEGKKISSILFELHNALADKYYVDLNMQAYFGKISKDQYVASVEKREYENSLLNSNILEHGIQAGKFPKEAYLPAFPSFEEHFKVQLEYGHSAAIAEQYDHMHQA